jgi:HEAT repeat protein
MPGESGRSESGTAVAVEQAAWLKASQSAADIARAKELAAEQRSQETRQLLEHPEQIWFVDRETEETLRENSEIVIPRLIRVAGAKEAEFRVRMRVAALLTRLGEVRGRQLFLSGLESDDPKQQVAALHGSGDLHTYFHDEGQPHIRFLLEEPGMTQRLLQQLDSRDPEVLKAAIQTCGLLEIPGHVEKFKQLIHDKDCPARGRIAYWLAAHAQPTEVIDDITTFYREGMTGEDAYSTIGAFDDLAEKGDEQTRRQVIALVREYYQRDDLDRRKLEPSVGWQLTSLIAKYAGADSANWLEEKLPDLEPYRRGDVYRALARMEADGWREMLADALRSNDTKLHAAQAFGEKLAGTQDAAVVKLLSESLSSEDSDRTISVICEALIAIGGDVSRQTVEAWLERTEPWDKMELTWQLRGRSLDDVREQVIESGWLTAAEFAAAREQLDDQAPEEAATNRFFALLTYANRLLSFDVETGELPCRHDELLLDFAEISGDRFRPTDVSQQWNQQHDEDFEADYTLRFVFNGRCYEARLNNLGDWYDVERLTQAANQALTDSGHPERFVTLYSGGQTANLTFGDPKMLGRLSKALAIPLADDPSQAMDEGKAFEQHVLDELRE